MDRNTRKSPDSSYIYGRLRDYSNDVVQFRPHAKPSVGGAYEIWRAPKKPTPQNKKHTQFVQHKNKSSEGIINPQYTSKITKEVNSSSKFHEPTIKTFQTKHPTKTKNTAKRPLSILTIKHQFMPKIITGMAVIMFVIGIVVAISSFRTNQAVVAQVQGQTSNDGGNSADGTPSEDAPTGDIGSYSVAPDLPKILTIEKIDLNSRITRIGVKPNNEMMTPNNVFNVGWYDSSSKPGENGAVVLNGHVSGPTKKGVFYKLGKLVAGDRMSIKRGDNELYNYKVVKIETIKYEEVDMSKVLVSITPGKPGLNLITCSGKFNSKTNSFEDRTLVYAVQE